MSDCISRQVAIKTALEYLVEYCGAAFDPGLQLGMSQKLNELPSVQPEERKTGHWILLTDCSNSGVYCSECNTKVFNNYPFKMMFSYFCPHCGTRMEGKVERR